MGNVHSGWPRISCIPLTQSLQWSGASAYFLSVCFYFLSCFPSLILPYTWLGVAAGSTKMVEDVRRGNSGRGSLLSCWCSPVQPGP